MQTFTEITREENERRARALRYERALKRRDAAKFSAARHERDAASLDLTPLREIHGRVGGVPRDLIFQGVTITLGVGLPGGMACRDLLMAVSSQALQQAEQRAAKTQRNLDAARVELANAEEALREFDEPSA